MPRPSVHRLRKSSRESRCQQCVIKHVTILWILRTEALRSDRLLRCGRRRYGGSSCRYSTQSASNCKQMRLRRLRKAGMVVPGLE